MVMMTMRRVVTVVVMLRRGRRETFERKSVLVEGKERSVEGGKEGRIGLKNFRNENMVVDVLMSLMSLIEMGSRWEMKDFNQDVGGGAFFPLG